MALLGAEIMNIGFIKWELALLAFLLLISVFIARGKGGIKRALMFLAVTCSLLAVEVFTKYLVVLGFDNPSKAVSAGIAWGPTVMFILTVFYATLIGIGRGFRKSAILLVHAVCVGAACIGLFFFCIKSEAVDKFALKAVNLFMGEGGLQSALGVSGECVTLRQVFGEYLPGLFGGYGQEVSIILRDNGAYIMTLADMAFRIVFAVLCGIVYFLLIFIMYIIYHCAYSERKYKKRKTALVEANKTDGSYRKHSVAGGIVGFVRGVAVGLVGLSFLGSILFIAAGGTGNGELGEYSFGDDNYDFGYSVYRSIESYGEHGIFKLLNKFKGTDDSPYYLFAADLILSGDLEDKNNGINQNIKLRKELGAYSKFARETMSLLLKHGEEEIKPIITGNADNVADTLIEVMSRPAFQAEFEELIDGFESQTYIINFAMSAVNSLISEIDNTSFASSIGEENRELLKLLFKPNYLSPYIPDEANGEITKAQPVFSVNSLFTKSDAKILYKAAVAVLSSKDSDDKFTMAKTVMPYLSELSLLDSSKSKRLDPVFARLYTYFANVYLTEEDGEGIKYSQVSAYNVQWVREINSLLSVAESGLEFYSALDAVEGDSIDRLLNVFDKNNPDYTRNIALYDECCRVIADSKILGKTLSTDFMRNRLADALSSVDENIYIPTDLVYENSYDSAGNLTAKGEFYNLLYGLRLLCTDDDNRKLLDLAVSDSNPGFEQILDAVSGLNKHTDGYDNSLAGYVTESGLLRSLISSVIINSGDTVSVPYSVCEAGTDGRVIEKSVLMQLFEELSKPEVIDALKLIEDDNVPVAELIKNEALLNVLKMGNGILEGTVANVLLQNLNKNSAVVIPAALKLPQDGTPRDIPTGWLTNRQGTAGELRRMLNVLDYIDLNDILGENADPDKIADQILGRDWKEDELRTLFDSLVLHYTVSGRILGGGFDMGENFSLIIPKDACSVLSGEDINKLIKTDELVTVLMQVSSLDINADSTAAEILRALNNNKEILKSYIISASMANFIASKDFLKIPEIYAIAARKENLEDRGAEVWKNELVKLLGAIDALFELDGEELPEFTDAALMDILGKRLNDFNGEYKDGKTRLEICCDSDIVLYNITDKIDNSILEWRILKTDGSDELLFTPQTLNSVKYLNVICNEYFYTYSELESLVNAVKVFEFGNIFDENGITGDVLAQKAEKKLLTLNDFFDEEGGKTNLEAIYESLIIRKLVTNEVDGVFNESRIDVATRESLKDNTQTYPAGEMSAVVNAVKAIFGNDTDSGDIKDLIASADFDDLVFVKQNLDVMYKSYLIAGCVSKAVNDAVLTADSVLVHHDKAYMDGYAIYREEEIRAVIEIVDASGADSGNINDFNLDNIDSIKKFIMSDADPSVPQSYLIAATLSHNIMNKQDVTVPMSAVDIPDKIIKPVELVAFIEAFEIICRGGGDTISNWSGITSVPSKEDEDELLKSAIVRATVTKAVQNANSVEMLVSENNTDGAEHIAVLQSDAITESNKTVTLIKNEQLKAMLGVLRMTEDGNGSFGLPNVDYAWLGSLTDEEIAEYVKCDILRYKVSELLLHFPSVREKYTVTEESAFDISLGAESAPKTVSALNERDIPSAVNDCRLLLDGFIPSGIVA